MCTISRIYMVSSLYIWENLRGAHHKRRASPRHSLTLNNNSAGVDASTSQFSLDSFSCTISWASSQCPIPLETVSPSFVCTDVCRTSAWLCGLHTLIQEITLCRFLTFVYASNDIIYLFACMNSEASFIYSWPGDWKQCIQVRKLALLPFLTCTSVEPYPSR